MSIAWAFGLAAYLGFGIIFALAADHTLRTEHKKQVGLITLLYAALFWLPIALWGVLSALLCKKK